MRNFRADAVYYDVEDHSVILDRYLPDRYGFIEKSCKSHLFWAEQPEDVPRIVPQCWDFTYVDDGRGPMKPDTSRRGDRRDRVSEKKKHVRRVRPKRADRTERMDWSLYQVDLTEQGIEPNPGPVPKPYWSEVLGIPVSQCPKCREWYITANRHPDCRRSPVIDSRLPYLVSAPPHLISGLINSFEALAKTGYEENWMPYAGVVYVPEEYATYMFPISVQCHCLRTVRQDDTAERVYGQ